MRLIVDREEEIRAFKSTEYWSIDGKFSAASSKKAFSAKLAEIGGAKAQIDNKEQADAILADLDGAEYIVSNLKKSQRKKQPAPPFTTSTLQQEASRKLSFQAKRTMKAAQELYEGVDVEDMGAVGLITYMRTDSLRISDEAKTAAAGSSSRNTARRTSPKSPAPTSPKATRRTRTKRSAPRTSSSLPQR